MSNLESYKSLLRTVLRKKKETDLIEPKLKRALGLNDLIYLGVGSTLGIGAYVLAGDVAVNLTGPAAVLSFLFAAVVSALSGLCYGEFASRVPKAGSAYAFSYVSIGEVVAFLIGWDLVLEYSIGCASVARSLTAHIDSSIDNSLTKFFNETITINVTGTILQDQVAEHPDFLSFTVIIILTIMIALGMQESSQFNKVFTIINLSTISIVVVSGLFLIQFYNWSIPKEEILKSLTPKKAEKIKEGGFLPFGWAGVFFGAAKCFYGFVGFDAIATMGEEAKKPSKDIPRAIVVSLSIITLSYSCIAIVLTLMAPFYSLDEHSPFIEIYKTHTSIQWVVIKWIVTIGAIFALFTNMIGSLFPLPRILYSMANDGLLYQIFAKVNPKTQTPFWGTIICGLFCAIISCVFDLQQLMNMMSIGTLMAYTLVCICVLILRYINDSDGGEVGDNRRYDTSLCSNIFNRSRLRVSTVKSARISLVIIFISLVLSSCLAFVLSLLVKKIDDNRSNEAPKPIFIESLICAVLGVCLFFLCCILSRQPQSANRPSFLVPFVPFVPCLGIFSNIFLMTMLDINTWYRFFVWLILGIFIYIFYGLRNSVEKLNRVSNEVSMNHVEYRLQNSEPDK